MERILVATDFSEDADRALAVAIRFGKLLKGTVDLVHVYDLPMPTALSVAGAVEPAKPAADDVLNAYRQLDERAASVREAGVDCAATAVGGDAPVEIVAQAQKLCANVLVMGRRGLSGLRRMVVGGVTERVLRTSGVPVLVIPPAT
ncbi:MAG TPA: universal stress protein [Polyangia bacterium]|jgi:nucleotide-binding universal stress UspA family protein|nr:universal stress protein [Polyangia bacterium]